jgi:predicted RecB family nuclease
MRFFEAGIDWDQGNCVGMPVNTFFDLEEMRASPQKSDTTEAVRAICFSCPIWADCLKWAFENEEFGVWGGLTGIERQSFMSNKFYENRVRTLKSIARFGIDEVQVRSLMNGH